MKFFKVALAALMALSCMLAFVACGPDEAENTATIAAATTTVKAEESSVQNTTTAVAATTKANAATTKKNNQTQKVSKVEELISRTKNSRGNPSDAFVNSLKGYNLTVYYPWQPESKGSIAELKKTALDCMSNVEKEFGVTIKEDGKFDNYNETLTAKLTANNKKSLAQIYQVQNFNYASYFKNNYMCDLTIAMAKSGVDFKDPWYVQDANAFFNVNNKQFAWIATDAEYVFPNAIIVYNKTLVKNKKLTDPVKLAQQGKWTWDTIIKYANKLDDSSKGITGFGTVSASQMLEQMLAQKGTALVNVKKGKSPTTNISNQKVKDTLSTLYTWCKKGGPCDTFANHDWTYAKTQFAAGKVALMAGGHDLIQTLRTSKKTTDEFGLVQFPTPTGSKKFVNTTGPHFAVFIPSVWKDDAAKILFLRNEMYRQNYRYAQRNFTYQWNKYFQDNDTLEYACNIKYARNNNTTKFCWTSVCEKSGEPGSGTVISAVLNSSSNNVQTAVSQNLDRIQKAYSKMWDGFKITGNV